MYYGCKALIDEKIWSHLVTARSLTVRLARFFQADRPIDVSHAASAEWEGIFLLDGAPFLEERPSVGGAGVVSAAVEREGKGAIDAGFGAARQSG